MKESYKEQPEWGRSLDFNIIMAEMVPVLANAHRWGQSMVPVLANTHVDGASPR